ncbi:hypothetical protein HMPREF0971_00062 [Segatella oris F0302]|uniref:Uncharacterized protein n=1 Tax=Segatella oris F0302 TaxID=649760 RepID=D1QMQ4_9BACT|nr:hypothetical protein HMPREF0971_00062 [Segatella oris F0302]
MPGAVTYTDVRNMILPKEGTLYCHIHTNLEINKLRKPCNLHQNTM